MKNRRNIFILITLLTLIILAAFVKAYFFGESSRGYGDSVPEPYRIQSETPASEKTGE